MDIHTQFLKFMANEDIFYPDHAGCLRAGLPTTPSHRITLRRRLSGNLAFIERLPNEILGVIFTFCLPKYEHLLPHIADAPLLLCHVCSTWRKVAIGIPQLWDSLMFVLPPKTTSKALSFGATTWLSRSGILPLKIRLDAHPAYKVPVDFFDIFAPYFPRWHNLKLHITSDALETLLRHPMAWSQLTTFKLSSDVSLVDCFSILVRCPKLQECFFMRVMEPYSRTPPPNIIPLRNLHQLKIYGRGDLYAILDCLETPQLRDLEITFYFPAPWQKQRMLAVFTRSRCPLQRLTIEGLDIPEADMLDLARRLPDLLEFTAVIGGKNLVPPKVVEIIQSRRDRTARREGTRAAP